ncbi:hypothetical protein B0T22DRAFT_476861 [Podospora appendiculata]|uniref:Uncharacterized protein n=1 Tax=Podospora appendiculata TaxID=314037 RepID=A0AAE0XIU8_9PEZI|nr:hypothetical protein B0T22DRAFT_476861 [Podospora appendiculata]
MRRAYPTGAGPLPPSCRVCELIYRQRPSQSAKRPFITLRPGRHLAKVSQDGPTTSVATRLLTASSSCLKVKRASGLQSLGDTQARFARSAVSARPSSSPGNRRLEQQRAQEQQAQEQPDPADLIELVAAVDRVTKAFMAQQGIPSEGMTLTSLRACAHQADVKSVLEAPSEHSAEVDGLESQFADVASDLLDLDSNGRTAENVTAPPTSTTATTTTTQSGSPLRPEDVVDKISEAAYAIITHPAVVITPPVLEVYVALQARLGKPETLPQILDLFATKPRPRLVSGSIRYTERNPHKIENAVEYKVAEIALDAAVKAKNLDAAIGIVEHTYATKASQRSKLVKKALLPVSVFGITPVVAYLVATNLSRMQDSMDQTTATNMTFVGILAYIGFTATIGIVATATANDQMKRVTWAPGTPLAQRWIREEERAAFDKIACSFGFSEVYRYGEEEGRDSESHGSWVKNGWNLDEPVCPQTLARSTGFTETSLVTSGPGASWPYASWPYFPYR